MNRSELQHTDQSSLFFKKEPGVELIMLWFARHSFRMEDLDYSKVHRHETAMHAACRQGNFRVVQWLVREGASLNVEDQDGNTPYHLACRAGHIPIQKFLLEKGASGASKNYTGVSASAMLMHTTRRDEDDVLDKNIKQQKNVLRDRNGGNRGNHIKGGKRNNPRMIFKDNVPSRGDVNGESGMMQGIDRAFVRSLLRKSTRTTCW